jgi:hypothetical protein
LLLRSRIQILKDRVFLHGDVEVLAKELSHYSWDLAEPLFKMSVEDFSSVLKRGINDEITFETLTNWANAIECRDDIEFANEEMQEIIFELANPEIHGRITEERLRHMVNVLANG